jgi:YHS domain-containing protein
VADVARAGEVVCTHATRRAIGPAVPLRDRGEATFKNVSEPVVLYEFVLTGRSGPALPVDPVCRMAVEPDQAVDRRERDGVTYYFCSQRCAAGFDA